MQDHNQLFHYAWLLILIGLVGWKEPKQGIFLNTNQNFRGAPYANLWETSEAAKQDANNMVFYYYYDQLCKAINSSPRVTREVIDTYRKICTLQQIDIIYICNCVHNKVVIGILVTIK